MYINKATLVTNQLNEMQKFYCERLGLQLMSSSDTSFEVQVGTSILKFHEGLEETHYHFAFNIPSNQLKEAKKWLKTKVDLLKEDGNDEVYFERSHAHSGMSTLNWTKIIRSAA